MADALQKLGLISEAEKNEALAGNAHTMNERDLHFRKLASKHGKSASLDRLETCSTINEFKNAAKTLLIEQPHMTKVVVEQAHRFKNEPGGDKLVWLCYEVRDKLLSVAHLNRERFLKRAFRRSGATVEIEG